MLREQYISMRKTGQIDIGWFYQYYIQQFNKLKMNYFHFIKDNYGNNLLEETDTLGSFRYKGEYKDSIMLEFQQFAQPFSMSFSMFSKEILDHMDKQMYVQKIEDSNGNILYID